MKPNGPNRPNGPCGPPPGSPETCAHSNPPASAAPAAPAATSVLVLIAFLPGAPRAPSLGVDETNVEGTWRLCEEHPKTGPNRPPARTWATIWGRRFWEGTVDVQ